MSIVGRHPNASLHHDVGMPSPISQHSPRSNALKPLVVRHAQSELKTLRRELDEMRVVVEKMSSDIERFRVLSSEKLGEVVAPRLDTAVQLIMHWLKCSDRRTNERIDSVARRSRESIEDVSDKLRTRMAEHDDSVGAIVAANNKLVRCIDVRIEEFRNQLYHSVERTKTKSSEEMRDAQLRDLMKPLDEYVSQQNSRMQKFAIYSVALRREIEARVSTSRPASEPAKNPQIFVMSRDDGVFSHAQPLGEHVPDVADLRNVASDQGGPLFPQGVIEHVPPGSLLNPI